MFVKDMFEKPIDRDIKGVITVGEEKDSDIQKELAEYVVTKELDRHFHDFAAAFCKAIDGPTDRMGIWISGFFGSGKSHFLKMLSHLLANRSVEGTTSLQHFEDKISDPMLISDLG